MARRKRNPRPLFTARQLRPDAPHLKIALTAAGWELRSDAGLIGTFPERAEAFEAALAISRKSYCEILYESLNGKYLHHAAQDDYALALRDQLRRRTPEDDRIRALA